MWWLVLGACGGGDKGGDDDDDSHSATITTETDEQSARCVRRCTRGSDGDGCDAAAIEAACEDYCVDPPPLPNECDPFFEELEVCVSRVDAWTCVGSTVTVGDVVVPVPADAYECRLEGVELGSCEAVDDPGCVPTLGGTGAACTLQAELCNAGGATFSADLLCDGAICSLLVDDGGGPVDTTFQRADQLCDELVEKQAVSNELLARFLVTLTGL
jgi:hypothetical protein